MREDDSAIDVSKIRIRAHCFRAYHQYLDDHGRRRNRIIREGEVDILPVNGPILRQADGWANIGMIYDRGDGNRLTFIRWRPDSNELHLIDLD
jgi:hypothetical protein